MVTFLPVLGIFMPAQGNYSTNLHMMQVYFGVTKDKTNGFNSGSFVCKMCCKWFQTHNAVSNAILCNQSWIMNCGQNSCDLITTNRREDRPGCDLNENDHRRLYHIVYVLIRTSSRNKSHWSPIFESICVSTLKWCYATFVGEGSTA